MPKIVEFGEFFKTTSLWSNSVTRQVTFNWTKIGENAKVQNLKCDIFLDFYTLFICEAPSSVQNCYEVN